jgi:hypothetical protein
MGHDIVIPAKEKERAALLAEAARFSRRTRRNTQRRTLDQQCHYNILIFFRGSGLLYYWGSSLG